MSELAVQVATGAKDLVTNFNYYLKKTQDEVISDRQFYQCPIFTTHNTFINHYGLSFRKGLSEKAVNDLDTFISHLVMLTNYFPICVEIDIKGITEDSDCTAGHYKTELEHKIKINELCIKIIREYYKEDPKGDTGKQRHPLILHLDIEKRECLEFDDIKKVYNEENVKKKAQLNDLKGFELSKTLYRDCMNKVIFREKIYGKKKESEENPGMVKVKRRSSALTLTPKRDFYFPLENLEKNGIPYITYKSSTGYHKGKFDFNLTTANQPFISCIFENQLEFHSRVFPGILPKKPQFKNSQEILNKTIDLFSAPNILYVPTLMAFNYKTPKPYDTKDTIEGEKKNPIILLAQKFCELYGTKPAEFNKLIEELEKSPYVTQPDKTKKTKKTEGNEEIVDTETESIYGDEDSEQEITKAVIDLYDKVFTDSKKEADFIFENGKIKSIKYPSGAEILMDDYTNDVGSHGEENPQQSHFVNESSLGGGSKKKKRVKKGKKLVIDKSTRKKKKKLRVSRKKKKINK